MNNENLIAVAIAGIAVWMLLSNRVKAAPASPAGLPPSDSFGKLIGNSALPGQPGYGWSYFTGGIAISPDGAYFKNGERVWAPGQ